MRSFSSPNLSKQDRDVLWSPASSVTTVRMSSARSSSSLRSDDGAIGQPISVVCRVRPISDKELREQSEIGVRVDPNGVGVDVSFGADTLHFDYDAVIGPYGSQQDVYELAAKPVVDDFLQGFNGTVFAYGQTGSGKTFSMEGVRTDAKKRGILPRVVKQVIEHKENAPKAIENVLQVQYLEIYNEKIRDLLAPNREDLKVREARAGIYVEGATSHFVTSEREVHDLLKTGAAARAVGETQMNQQSSRSHSIFIFTLEQTNTADNTKKKAKLFMVDLAGSEMVKHTGSEGVTLREAQHINKSLSALSNVITSLSERHHSHIPYRNSKLTRLLQDAIGGNCRTSLIICCSPAKTTETETVSTMRFGRSAKKIKNRARVNKESSDKELAIQLDEMKRRNRELQERLDAKTFEVQTLQAAGGKHRGTRDSFEEIGPEAAKRIVDAKEEVIKATEKADIAEAEKKALEKQLEDTVNQYEDQMDEMQSELESLQYQLKQKERSLFRSSNASFRSSIMSSQPQLLSPAPAPGAGVTAVGVHKCLGQLQQLELHAAAAAKEEDEGPSDASVRRLVDAVKALAETMKEHLQGRGGGLGKEEGGPPPSLEPELQEELVARYDYMRFWRQKQETDRKQQGSPPGGPGAGEVERRKEKEGFPGLPAGKKVAAPAGVLKKRAPIGSPLVERRAERERAERGQTPGHVRPWTREKNEGSGGGEGEDEGAEKEQLSPGRSEGEGEGQGEVKQGRRKGKKKTLQTEPDGKSLWGLGHDLLVTYH